MAFSVPQSFTPEQQILQHFRRLSNAARLAAVLLLVVTIGLVWSIFSPFIWQTEALPQPEPEKWQAVFLTNGQVYFGHLRVLNNRYYLLNDIYYTQTGTPPTSGSSVVSPSQPNLYLVKLAGEIHGPEDAMYIPNDRILFWENLREDSQVIKTIEKTQR